MVRYVDDYTALLSGQRLNNGPAGTMQIVSYSFLERSELPALRDLAYQADEVSAMTAAQREGARDAFAEVSNASGLNFIEVPHGGTISVYDVDGSRYGGWGTIGNVGIDQDLVYDNSSGKIIPDYFGYDVMVHEILHNVGLKHPFEGNIRLKPSLDNTYTTVMAYKPGTGVSGGLRPLDTAAIDHLYGDENSDASIYLYYKYNLQRMTIEGSFHSEAIGSSNWLHSTILALEGDDAVYGNVHTDHIFGGDGDDRLFGGAGNDLVKGQNDDDRLFGGTGNDTVNGGAGNDVINAPWFGRDDFRFDGGINVLKGGVGQDRIFVTGERDTVDGGAGRDSIYLGDARHVTVAFGHGADVDVVHGFDPDTDHIKLVGDDLDAATVIAGALRTDGGVALRFGDGDVLHLEGVHLSDLHTTSLFV